MKKLLDGKKNAVIVLSGGAPGKFIDKITHESLEEKPKKLRVEAILYSLEKECTVRFEDFIIPLSGRGKLDFEQFHSLPVDTDDILVDGEGAYFLMFDLEKIQ